MIDGAEDGNGDPLRRLTGHLSPVDTHSSEILTKRFVLPIGELPVVVDSDEP